MKKLLVTMLCGSLLIVSGVLGAETVMKIDNEFYSVDVDADGGTFAVLEKLSGKTFLRGGQLSSAGGTARIATISHAVFGSGKVIEINYPNGNRESVALYPGTPFVLFQTTLHNGGKEPVVLNHVPTVSAVVELNKPAAEVATLGTGGLLPPAKNPGSYAFLALVDPQIRSGVVAGWLSHDRGSGVVFSPVQGNTVRVQAQLDYGRLRIKPGGDAAAETFAIGYFADARFGLEAYADAVAKVYAIKLPAHRPGLCTWYMEKHAGACDEKFLPELADYAAKNLKPFGLDFLQIDDGWQEGILLHSPKKNFTTHALRGPFPSGMKVAANAIGSLNLTPGIWFMPFAGTSTDPYYKDHQDWFAKGSDGKPFETEFGGTCLDMTQTGAREHVRSVVQRIAHEWGYGVFKMDAFWTGSATRLIYPNNGYRDDAMGEAGFSNADVTNIEALRSGVKLVRETAGPGVFLLGCCVSQNMRSFGGGFGLLDAMRVGPDTGGGRIGVTQASRLWFLNGRVWWNDPDCVMVRAATPLAQAQVNASFAAIAGDLFYNSDWMPDLPPERLNILRRCMPPHYQAARPVDVFQNEPARIWHLADVRQERRRDVVALYNWRKAPASIEETAERIGLPPAKEYVAFDFWANQFIPRFRGTLRADLPAGDSCKILAVQPALDHPQLLSTSRHVTQGMVDVTGETWDDARAILSASSKMVANDLYELRIVVPVNEKSWNAAYASVSAEDQAAGVKATMQQDGPNLRVAITSPVSREVQWRMRFARAGVPAQTPESAPPIPLPESSADRPKGAPRHSN